MPRTKQEVFLNADLSMSPLQAYFRSGRYHTGHQMPEMPQPFCRIDRGGAHQREILGSQEFQRTQDKKMTITQAE